MALPYALPGGDLQSAQRPGDSIPAGERKL
jgi:hypothetical protein